MSKLVMTESILKEIYDDDSFKAVTVELLNSLIDAELQKEEPDFDFIDECADVLIEIQSGNVSAVIPFIKKNNNTDDKKRKTLGIFLACAVVFSLSLGAVAVSHTIERKNEDKTTTATTMQTTVTTTRKATTSVTTTKKSASKAVDLWLSFPDGFVYEYDSIDDFTFDGIIANVEYSDGTVKKIGINNCKIIKSEGFGTHATEKITVEYEGLSSTFFILFSNNIPPITIGEDQHINMGKPTRAPKIEPASQYIELAPGESVTLTMRKNNDGFVYTSTDNNNLADISVSYLGGVNGREIYLEITAGDTPGVTTISLKYDSYLSTAVMSRITVKVVENSKEANTENYDG